MTSQNTFELYRSGAPLPPAYSDELRARVAFIDSFCPKGRVSRQGALFCAPDQKSLAFWHNSSQRKAPSQVNCPHRLTVRDDFSELFVYPTQPFETAWNYYRDYQLTTGWDEPYEDDLVRAQIFARSYWDAGITLSDWVAGRRPDDTEQREWFERSREVLVRPDMVQTREGITSEELAAYGCRDTSQTPLHELAYV